MNWVERNTENTASGVAAPKAAEFDEAKLQVMPVITKEAGRGEVPVQQVHFQPVKSPGIYEAEFANKDGTVIFHFWPYGYHQAERDGKPTPRFKPDFEKKLRAVMVPAFGERALSFEQDKDMGSWFVSAAGWGERQFYRDLAIKACRDLHYALGGTDG